MAVEGRSDLRYPPNPPLEMPYGGRREHKRQKAPSWCYIRLYGAWAGTEAPPHDTRWGLPRRGGRGGKKKERRAMGVLGARKLNSTGERRAARSPAARACYRYRSTFHTSQANSSNHETALWYTPPARRQPPCQPPPCSHQVRSGHRWPGRKA